MKPARPKLTGVYVHLPFCDVKCAYCDFYSLARRHTDAAFWRDYTTRLIGDLEWQYQRLIQDTPAPVLTSVFFGGGTPSKAPGFLFEQLIAAIRGLFSRSMSGAEISGEANPESLTREVLEDWRGAGINRVSIGLQSLDERVLKYLGRLYNPEAYAQVLGLARTAGFSNINADFITGVPGQSIRSTLDDLDFALGQGVSHISLYQLTVEDGTLLKQRVQSGSHARPSDANQVRQMDAAIEHLEKRGFRRYEISNFASDGRSCRHNRIYWTNRPYLGLGVSAHGFTGKRRFFHARSLEKYMAGEPPAEDTASSHKDALINLVRLRRPFPVTRVLSFFPAAEAQTAVRDILDAAFRDGWFEKKQALLMPTHLGLKHTDTLLAKLWAL